jgi:hypothetical protein
MAENKQPPPWLELVQRFERAIGEPIESFVRSDAYFDLTTQLKRARGRMTRSVEQVAEEWLHFFNIPAATDLRRMREQLSRLERQVNRVAKDLADRAEAEAAERGAASRGGAKPRPKSRTARKPGSKSKPRTDRS